MIPLEHQHLFDQIEAVAQTDPNRALAVVADLPDELRRGEFGMLLQCKAHMRLGDADTTMRLAHEGVKLNPTSTQLIHLLSAVLASKGYHSKALDVLREFYPIELKPWELLFMASIASVSTFPEWAREALKHALLRCDRPDALARHILEEQEPLIPILHSITKGDDQCQH